MTEGEAQLLAVRLEASLAKFEKQLKRGYDVAKKMSTAMEQRFADMELKTQKSAEASGVVIQRELERRRKGYESLMASMDPVFAATLRFKGGEKKLADALKYGEISAKEHARAMRLLKAQYDSVKASAAQTGTAVRRAGMPMRGFGGMAQQIGYQVGDFAVQVGNGTSAITAFAQQGSQLLGVLGPWGAVGGAALAILAPLTASILDLGDGSEEAGRQVKTFADAMDVAEAAIADADSAIDSLGDMERLKEMYGSVTDEVLDLVRALAALAQEKAFERTSSAISKFFSENSQMADLQDAIDDRMRAIGRLQAELDALRDPSRVQFGVMGGAVDRTAEILSIEADLQRLRSMADIELKFGVSADVLRRVQELRALISDASEAGDMPAMLEAVDELRELLSPVPDGLFKSLGDGLAEAESLLRKALAQKERFNEAIKEDGEGVFVGGLRSSELVKKYDRDTVRLKELAAEREQILRAKDVAMSEGNLEGARQAERMLRAIEEEIDRLDDSTERVEVMQEQVSKLQELLGYLRIDESGELADGLDMIKAQLKDAEALGNKLDQVTLDALEGEFDRVIGAAERLLRKVGLIKGDLGDLGDLKLPDAGRFEAEYVARSVSGAGRNDEELVRAVLQVSEKLGIAAKDLLAVMSFETGGTFDPWKAGPTTQWGQHRGLIQWGEPQRAKYGVTASSTIAEQVEAAGRYLSDAGVKAGDGLARIYAAVLAGDANKIHASDAHNGGAVSDVLAATGGEQFNGHRARAEGLLRAYAGVSEEFRQSMSEEQKAERERERETERVIQSRERELGLRRSLVEAAQQHLSDAEFEATLIGRGAAEQARLRAEYMLTQDAKRRGIGLNEKLAGQEKTYSELIREQAAAIGQVVAAKEAQILKNEDLAQQESDLRQLGDSIKDSLLDAVLAADSFEDALAGVVKMLARAALQAAFFNEGPMASSGGGKGLLGGLFDWMFGGGNVTPSAKGNVFSGGRVQPFAKGGVVDGPVLFPMRGGTGLMGEAGPEAIMPLSRGADGKLGVRTNGGSSAKPQDVHINVNVAGARGNMEVQEMVAAGVRQGISQYDQSLPSRVRQIKADPRRI